MTSEAQSVIDGKRNWAILRTDAISGLRTLPPKVFHVVTTSPPYWGLRTYLPANHVNKHMELGAERTPGEYISNQVDVFREVKRVLRDDGVCWLNIGDSYNAYNGNRGKSESLSGLNGTKHPDHERGLQAEGLRAGNLVGIPWLLAFALRNDGWYLRNDCIWAKKSPMPESVNGTRWEKCRVKVASRDVSGLADRATLAHVRPQKGLAGHTGYDCIPAAEYEPCPGCPKCIPNDGWVLRKGSWRHTRAHEYLFMLTKSADYFCDAQAVAEVGVGREVFGNIRSKGNCEDRNDNERRNMSVSETRNPRSVITLSSEPLKQAHFAAFPTELIRPALLAATSEKGCCPECGAPWARMVERTREATRPATNNKRTGKEGKEVGNSDPERHVSKTITHGWKATCNCNAGEPIPCLALDHYNGAGTSGVVARRLGLRYIGIELNEEYATMAEDRIRGDMPLMNY